MSRAGACLSGLTLLVACKGTERRSVDELDTQVAAALEAHDPTTRLTAALAAAQRPDDPRDREGRPPLAHGERATRWRPYRIHRAVAAGAQLLFSHSDAGGTSLSLAREGKPDRRLVTAPASHVLFPLAIDERFAYYDHELAADDDGDRASSLRRVSLAGGRDEELGQEPTHAVIAGDWLYWSSGGGAWFGAPPAAIHGLHRRTGATVEVREPAADTVLDLAATRDQLYVLVHDQPARPLDLQPAHLLALALDGRGAPAADASLIEVGVMTSDRPTELAVEDDRLYYVTEGATLGNDGTVRRWDGARRAADTLATGLASPMDLTAAAGHLCFGLMRPGDVRAVACLRLADGRLLVVHSSSAELVPYSPVQLGGRVLWSQEATGADGDETVGVSLGAARP